MKKVLVGTFYILQAICHLIVFVFPIRVRGFNGGGMAGLEIMIRYYFALASCLSILAALLLFLGLKYWACNYLAKYAGIASSSLFILFYVFLITGSSSNIQMGYYVYHYSILLMVSLIIVVLNVVSMIGLYSFVESKRIRD